jgi:transcriptional regulator with XRE-family HTH domain
MLPSSRATEALQKRFNKRGEQARLARVTGISQSRLSRLAKDGAAGRKTAQLLSRHAGIPMKWWDEPPVNHNAVNGKSA